MAPLVLPQISSTMSDEDYASFPAVSASNLRSLYRFPPARARKDIETTSHAQKKISDGQLVHLLTLEPQKAHSLIRVQPKNIEGETFKLRKKRVAFHNECQAQGHIPVPAAQYDRAQRALKALQAHSAIAPIISSSSPEQTILWHDEEFQLDCRSRIDLVHPSSLYDLKTTSHGFEEEDFKKSIGQMGYLIQAAWYQRAYHHAQGSLLPFSFIIVELKSQRCRIHSLSSEEMEIGLSQVRKSMQAYQYCTKSGIWPGHFL